MAGSENYSCGAKRVQGEGACVAIESTISDHIIRTLFSFTERAALVKDRVICIGSLLWIRSIYFVARTS